VNRCLQLAASVGTSRPEVKPLEDGMDIIQILNRTTKDSQLSRPTASMPKIHFKTRSTDFMVLSGTKMIAFINRWFISPKMDLHDIHRSGDTIKTEWTLSWNTPLPWKPCIAIPGWSELRLNSAGLIVSTSIPGSVHA